MKKSKLLYLSLFISGLVIMLVGSCLAVFGLVLNETSLVQLLLKIFGGIGAFLGITMLAMGLFKYYISNKSLEISEKDERNVAIRGKAAQSTCLITIFLLLALMITFVLMELTIAALLVGIVMMVSSFLQMILIVYYDKKSSTNNEDSEDLK